MFTGIPYCGLAPLPGQLALRWNFDPALVVALAAISILHLWKLKDSPTRDRVAAGCGWLVASIALISPLCALSVALFSARVGQHMVLVLVAAPLIALGIPRHFAPVRSTIALSAVVFFLSLWFWHMPYPYEATFENSSIYWTMHITLFCSALWLWRELLHHAHAHTGEALLVGALTSMQMGLLGALLSLADHAFYPRHLLSSWAWGLTPLEDQQLGGVTMWVPGIALFLWIAIRSLLRMWAALEGARAT